MEKEVEAGVWFVGTEAVYSFVEGDAWEWSRDLVLVGVGENFSD